MSLFFLRPLSPDILVPPYPSLKVKPYLAPHHCSDPATAGRLGTRRHVDYKIGTRRVQITTCAEAEGLVPRLYILPAPHEKAPVLTRLKTALAGLPWWVVLLLGMACVVLGGVLIARPFGSLWCCTGWLLPL